MNLKIYRKFFVLIALTVGLFFAISANKTSAESPTCCDECMMDYNYCVQYTCQYEGRDCITDICVPDYNYCTVGCYPQEICPIL